MFKAVYYFIGLMFMAYELLWMLNPIEKTRNYLDLQDKTKKLKSEGIKYDDWPEDIRKTLQTKLIYILPLFLWVLMGVFTFQWPLFIAFLLYMVLTGLLNNLTKHIFSLQVTKMFIGSLVGFLVSGFSILNAYHLKIDIWQYILFNYL